MYCSKRFTLYLLNLPLSRRFWEASSHAASNAQRLFVHKYARLSIARYSSHSIMNRRNNLVKIWPRFHMAAYNSSRVLIVESPKLFPLHHYGTIAK